MKTQTCQLTSDDYKCRNERLIGQREWSHRGGALKISEEVSCGRGLQ